MIMCARRCDPAMEVWMSTLTSCLLCLFSRRFKYLILADGNTVSSSRSRSMLFSRSAMIKQTSPASEFFYPMLQPYVHYLPVAQDFQDIQVVLEWARDHDDEMQAMANKARVWAEHHLMDDSIMRYVSLLLHKYHGLLTFKPHLTPDMLKWKVNFSQKIRGWISSETQRTCTNTSVYPITSHERPVILWT